LRTDVLGFNEATAFAVDQPDADLVRGDVMGGFNEATAFAVDQRWTDWHDNLKRILSFNEATAFAVDQR